LKSARALGTHLTVALSSDTFNQLKGKDAKFSWEQRKLDLEGVRYVDDWERKFDFLKEHCYVVYLGRT